MENTPQRKEQIKQFIERWEAAEGNEDREARSFLIQFLQDVLGFADATRVLDFERRVKGRKIDAFMEDMGILVEAKSRGIDLDHKRDNGKKYGFETPYEQAKWYADNMPNSVRPRWLIVHNFDEFRIHDLELEHPGHDYQTVTLDELGNDAARAMFGFFTDKAQSRLIREKELSVEAGAIVGKLYDAFAAQYQNIDTDEHEQRSLNILIVRLVFLLYAEDAGLFNEHQAFYKYMREFDAQQSRQALLTLFQVLDTPPEKRDPYLREDLKTFPYVNGSLFAEEGIAIPQLTEETRFVLLQEASCGFDWSDISPTIFGAVFESTLNPETRRAGGMHYTSIENIHKVIDPLFMDDLRAELAEIEGITVEKTRNLKLRAFQDKLASLDILDPACGSGNFLTESYIQLRKLENRVIESLQAEGQVGMALEGEESPVKVSIDQFYGIEINDFAVSVAKTALWIAESQMLDETQELLLQAFDFFPLTTNAHVIQGNALRMDWNDLLPSAQCSYICGNPPFIGYSNHTPDQAEDRALIFDNCKVVDYVACWYIKAAEYMNSNTAMRAAFVSTNSITQGQQVEPIWRRLFDAGIHIDFAWQSFVWNSEVANQAQVHVVIIGFSKAGSSEKKIYDRDGNCHIVANINGYLKPAADVFATSRSRPLCNVPPVVYGLKPADNGYLILDADERVHIVSEYPSAEKMIRPFVTAREFLNGTPRYCLWLFDYSDEDIASIPPIAMRVARCKEWRLEQTVTGDAYKLADRPHLMRPSKRVDVNKSYIVIPLHTGERRRYIPLAFMESGEVPGNSCSIVPDANLFHFGILESQFHNAWMRVVCGRIKSDYRYASDIVYNNFIWPEPTDEQRNQIEVAAQAILDARENYPESSLAELYDPDKMPADLLAAHKALDAAVEAAYGVDFDGDEEKIVAHLFKLYADAVKDE